MIRHGRWGAIGNGRVNPLAPAVVVVAGLVCLAAGSRWIGAGLVIGALLALMNGMLLSRRVDAAADLGDVGQAMIVMQLGLVATFTIVGIVTIVLVKLSLAMAVAAAAGFALAQLAMLVLFYLNRARRPAGTETNI